MENQDKERKIKEQLEEMNKWTNISLFSINVANERTGLGKGCGGVNTHR